MKPFDGMTTEPYGLPLMGGAWAALLVYCTKIPDLVDAFRKDTGFNLLEVLNASGINKMIDESTGHDKAVIVAWADWVTKNIWGEEGNND